MKSSEILAAGYAIPFYDMRDDVRIWHTSNGTHTLPAGAVMPSKVVGISFNVARASDVYQAAKG